MIAKFLFSNFYSFADEAEISFEVGKQPGSSVYDIVLSEERRLNKVIAVVGANGSGKTQLLRPLAFLSWFIVRSFSASLPNEKIPYEPHALYKNKDSYFEVFFNLNGEDYKYKLIVNRDHVVHESLHKKTSIQYSYVFIRERKAQGYSFKQKGFGFSTKLAEHIRSNASIVSAAYIYGVEAAVELVKSFDDYACNVNVSGRVNNHEDHLFESAEYFYQNKDVKSKMLDIICDLDFGLSSVEIMEVENKNDQDEIEKFYLPVGVHSINGAKFKLPFSAESSGTQSAFVLLGKLLPILATGGLAIIDEIDNDLHPHMLPRILELFKFPHTNPHNAQIIFSCHTPEILNVLKKHQVYLVEKKDLASETWRLDEVNGLRTDDNIYAKYHSGSLGAVPYI